jgi:predicted nucleotidyltransferase
MAYQLPIDSEILAQICRRQHIRRLSLFGSVLAGTAQPESDIDLLIEEDLRFEIYDFRSEKSKIQNPKSQITF